MTEPNRQNPALGVKFKRHIRVDPIHVAGYIVLGIGALLMAYPILFIIMASFFTPAEFNTTVVGLFPIAEHPTWDNIKALFFVTSDRYTLIYYRNSLIITAYSTTWTFITCLLAGYVFGRLQFKGKEVLFMIMLTTQMIPGIVSVMPTYLELVRFPFAGGNWIFMGGTGLYDTWGVYILLFGGMLRIMGTFLVKQAVESLPVALEDAARVDGASFMRILFVIVMPNLKPVLAYVTITTAIGAWNNWEAPFYYTNSRELQTIASSLTKLTSFAGKEGDIINYPAIMSFSLLLTIPCIIIFFIFQKFIVQGLVSAGIKG